MSVRISSGDMFSGYAISFSHGSLLMASANGHDRETKSCFTKIGAMNILGYIPGVSLIVGIARIIFSQVSSLFREEDGKIQALKQAQVVRGALECASVFGPILFIADIAMTILLLAQRS